MVEYYANYEDILALPESTRNDIANWIDIHRVVSYDNGSWVIIVGKTAEIKRTRAKLMARLNIDYKRTVRVRQF